MGSRLVSATIRYYMALRISAAVISTWMPLEPRADPSPVVRSATMTSDGEFDIREVVETRGRLHVVTLPADSFNSRTHSRQQTILPN
jgi:hypothetical protein